MLAEAVETIEGVTFEVTQTIGEGEVTVVEYTEAVLAEDGVTVTLTVAPVTATAEAQSVVYTVDGVEAAAFEVAADLALVEEAAVAAATAAVEKAEETLATEDIQAAKEAVVLVETPKVNANLNARITLVEKAVTDFLAAVKAQAVADNEIDLFTALNAKATPFDVVLLADAGVVKSNSAAYLATIKGSDSAEAATATIEALKAAIKAANDAAASTELNTLFGDVNTAVTALTNLLDTTLNNTLTEEQFTAIEKAIVDVQSAIDALPADAVDPTDAEVTKETLQEGLDNTVQAVNEYVEFVLPVVVANASPTQFDLFDTLNELGYTEVKSANITAYRTAIAGTEKAKAEIQEIIYTVNASALVANISLTEPTQAAIDAAQVAVDKLAEDNAEKAGLQATIDTAQTALDANIAAAADLALAQEKAATAKVAYEATGLDTTALEYTALVNEIAAPTDASTLTNVATDVETLVAAYQNAVEVAEAALVAYETAKGDVEEAVYTDLTTALAAELKVTTTIETATAALVAATELIVAQAKAAEAQKAYDETGLDTLVTEYTTLTDEITSNDDATALTDAAAAVEVLVTAYNAAVETAEAALAAYDVAFTASGADTKDASYEALEGELEKSTPVTADIEGATTALKAVTELLQLNNAINKADVDTLSAIVAAYGITDAKGYYTLSKVQRPEFIDYLIGENTDEEGVSIVTDVATFKAQVSEASTEVTAYLALISNVNTATDVTVLITSLEAANADYAALEDAILKLEIADAIFEEVKASQNATSAAYDTLSDIAAAIVAATPAE